MMPETQENYIDSAIAQGSARAHREMAQEQLAHLIAFSAGLINGSIERSTLRKPQVFSADRHIPEGVMDFRDPAWYEETSSGNVDDLGNFSGAYKLRIPGGARDRDHVQRSPEDTEVIVHFDHGMPTRVGLYWSKGHALLRPPGVVPHDVDRNPGLRDLLAEQEAQIPGRNHYALEISLGEAITSGGTNLEHLTATLRAGENPLKEVGPVGMWKARRSGRVVDLEDKAQLLHLAAGVLNIFPRADIDPRSTITDQKISLESDLELIAVGREIALGVDNPDVLSLRENGKGEIFIYGPTLMLVGKLDRQDGNEHMQAHLAGVWGASNTEIMKAVSQWESGLLARLGVTHFDVEIDPDDEQEVNLWRMMDYSFAASEIQEAATSRFVIAHKDLDL